MRQRANIARALAINPQVLLMDEPFSALDAQTREIMQLELARIWQRDRNTIVFITHQIDEAVFLSDRVIVLGRRPGRIIETVEIDIPHPRDLATKRTARSADYVGHIWKLIEQQVFESLEEDKARSVSAG
jgi:NitT/TauT family transport system ATP-binding protein